MERRKRRRGRTRERDDADKGHGAERRKEGEMERIKKKRKKKIRLVLLSWLLSVARPSLLLYPWHTLLLLLLLLAAIGQTLHSCGQRERGSLSLLSCLCKLVVAPKAGTLKSKSNIQLKPPSRQSVLAMILLKVCTLRSLKEVTKKDWSIYLYIGAVSRILLRSKKRKEKGDWESPAPSISSF